MPGKKSDETFEVEETNEFEIKFSIPSTITVGKLGKDIYNDLSEAVISYVRSKGWKVIKRIKYRRVFEYFDTKDRYLLEKGMTLRRVTLDPDEMKFTNGIRMYYRYDLKFPSSRSNSNSEGSHEIGNKNAMVEKTAYSTELLAGSGILDLLNHEFSPMLGKVSDIVPAEHPVATALKKYEKITFRAEPARLESCLPKELSPEAQPSETHLPQAITPDIRSPESFLIEASVDNVYVVPSIPSFSRPQDPDCLMDKDIGVFRELEFEIKSGIPSILEEIKGDWMSFGLTVEPRSKYRKISEVLSSK